MAVILVTPSTILATSGPKSRSISARVVSVSSTVSWRKAAAMEARSSFSRVRIRAASKGWAR